MIRWLMRKKVGDRPEFHHAALNELMQDRANTPTMGGIAFVVPVLIYLGATAGYDVPSVAGLRKSSGRLSVIVLERES